ncbi:unnamed protein product [Allacma fusca]|uniref:Uncharacterized protein n=1 Tax=Allacma fusca TaxID=39272 RepID=A0A8J2L8J6_9HEXA|nr:unnamed protein product [Allacma fusca]
MLSISRHQNDFESFCTDNETMTMVILFETIRQYDHITPPLQSCQSAIWVSLRTGCNALNKQDMIWKWKSKGEVLGPHTIFSHAVQPDAYTHARETAAAPSVRKSVKRNELHTHVGLYCLDICSQSRGVRFRL